MTRHRLYPSNAMLRKLSLSCWKIKVMQLRKRSHDMLYFLKTDWLVFYLQLFSLLFVHCKLFLQLLYFYWIICFITLYTWKENDKSSEIMLSMEWMTKKSFENIGLPWMNSWIAYKVHPTLLSTKSTSGYDISKENFILLKN